MGPARRDRPGPVLDAAAGLPAVHDARARRSPGSSRRPARTATGPAGCSTRTSATPTPSRCSGCTTSTPARSPTWTPPSSTRCSPAAFMAAGRRRSAGSTTARPRPWGLLPDGARRPELLRRHLPAAVAVRPAHDAGGARPVRAAGRGTRRWSGCPRCCSCTPSPTGTSSRSRWPRSACGRGRGSRPVLAGVLLGLGIAAKLYPVLLLGALFLLCLRAGRLRDLAADGGGRGRGLAGGERPARRARAGELEPVLPAQQQPAGRPGHRSGTSCCTLTDQRAFDGPLADGQSPDGAQRRRRRAPRAAGRRGRLADARRARAARGSPSWPSCCVAGFLLLNKVWSPQYSLWLLPLAVLARPRWRSLLLWQADRGAALGAAAALVPRRGQPRRRGASGSSSAWCCATSPSSCSWRLVVRDVLRPDERRRPDDVARRRRPRGGRPGRRPTTG